MKQNAKRDQKVCNQCAQLKSLDQFYIVRRSNDGRASECKPCAVKRATTWAQRYPERVKAKMRAWYAANRDTQVQKFRDKYWRQPEKYRRRAKRWREENPLAYAALKLRGRAKRYGLSLVAYQQLLLRQNGACALCKRPLGDGKRDTCIDHDHRTGAVRGILHNACNRLIGVAHEDPALLHAAAQYVLGFSTSVREVGT